LNYLSQSIVSTNEIEKIKYINSAQKIITAVFDCLGNPRDDSQENLMLSDTTEGYEGKYIGLRIGKTNSRGNSSDPGMNFDGMYFHYFDKFLFALIRFAAITNDSKALNQAIHLVKTNHPYFFVKGKGIRWKLNINMSKIKLLPEPTPNHDLLSAYIIYNIINNHSNDNILKKEIIDLEPLVAIYFSKSVNELMQGCIDPLGKIYINI
jgi:hypothetical protein